MTVDLLKRIENGETAFLKLDVDELDLRDIEATDLSFRQCTFAKVDFGNAYLEGMTCSDCKFVDCSFVGAVLEDSRFLRSSFYQLNQACVFARADLRFSAFEGCDVRLCSFQYGRLLKSTWKETNATGADFFRADFGRAVVINDCHFRMTDLREADLRGCDLSKTDFEQANLENAKLQEANLSSCNFAGSNLRYAVLKGADCRGANISSFDIRTMDLTDVKIYQSQGKVLLENAGLALFDD